MKKITSLLLAVIMIVGLIPFGTIPVFAAELATVKVESVSAIPGSTVDVSISINNNPGIASMGFALSFDEALTLVGATNGEAFSELTMTPPAQLKKTGSITGSCRFAWLGNENAIEDGTILNLKFKVADNAELNKNCQISLLFNKGDVLDDSRTAVDVIAENGKVTIINYTPGDVDGNSTINMLDVLTLCQFYVDGCRYDPNGYAVDINPESGDVDASGFVNMLDVLMICQYYVDGCKYDPAGYGVKLLPGKKACEHSMQHFNAKEATCTESGNIEYWYCDNCNDYFADETGIDVITLEYTVTKAKGHTIVVDQAVPATYEHTGLTEGSHCLVCHSTIVKQEETPKLQSEQYSIKYNISNGDAYLASQTIDNPNPDHYATANGLTLKNISVPGYIFLGWYDLPSGANAEIIKKISAGTKEDIEVYAHWEKIEYTVQFDSALIQVGAIKYTVDKGAALPVPHLDGYIFTGWSDDDGIILKTISVGTTGNKVYKANWLSERNKAWTKNKLDKPIIIEDEDTGTILFTYEIGRIENVPLYTIEDFGYINSEGVTRTVSKEYTVKTDKTLMEQYANNIANATTNSSQWSLSSGWSDAVSVNENYLKEQGLTEEDAETICKTDSDNWQISSGTSGSTTTTEYDSSQNYNLHTATGNTKTYDTHDDTKQHKQSASLDINAKYECDLIVESIEVGVDIGASYEQTNTHANKTGTESDSGNNDQTGTIKHTGTDKVSTGGWNKSSSYGGSNSVSQSNSVSKTVSEKIASEYGYGRSYIKTGDEANTQGLSTSSSASNTYTAAVTYGTEETTKESITYTTGNTKTGYHRLIKAGTAHVFAIVGYDIKTASYFVTTYTVMDDETHNFEDYSYTTALYDDNQSGVIPFEVPYEVEEYVLDRVGETEGLEFNKAGIVTGYNGNERTVVIPEYHVVDNLDGTKTVMKITGIDTNAFKGNTEITGIELSDYITEIPANAFEGCSALSLVNMPGVVSIGKEAFKNCIGIDYLFISNKIRYLGNNAFVNLNVFAAYTDCIDVIEGAVDSGAKNIAIYLSDSNIDFNGKKLAVSEQTNTFILNGGGYEFENLTLISDADETLINNITINSNTNVPLKISSPKVQLDQVNVTSSGISLILTEDNCKLGLYGESVATSLSDIAILCRNLEIYKTEEAIKNGVYSELKVNDNVYACGKIINADLLKCSGKIISISEEEYAKYLKGLFKVTFDASGGTSSSNEIAVLYGTKYGTLPTATRTGYTFNGWYTAKTGGTKVTETTVVDYNSDITLYAHWTVKSYTATWSSGTGYTITVKRTSSPNKGAATGTLSSGVTVYYGDVLSITYTASTGYSISTKGSTSITVKGNVTSSNIYATAAVKSYTATWSTGTGYTITVKRTSSPIKGAATGNLSSGVTVYYGDVLSITYTASTGYSFDTKGKTSITVSQNITSSDIYATASPNSYTYTIKYKSSNGTDLGSSSATYKFGTTNTITAPEKTGYITPSSQSVKWDATSKTVTFTYAPKTVASSQLVDEGWWWQDSNKGIKYYVTAEIANRTETSVQVRIVWKQSIQNGCYGYYQTFTASVNGWNTANTGGTVLIATSSTWPYGRAYTDSVTVCSEWMTVPVSATTTSVEVGCDYQKQWEYLGSISNTIDIPAY